MRRVLIGMLLWAGVASAAPGGVVVEELRLDAPGVSDKPLRLRVYLPPDYQAGMARYETLYVNDGQDMEAVGLQATLDGLYGRYRIRRIIVVAIDMPPDRMAGYGYFDRATGKAIVAPTKYGPVGANAAAYAQWLVQTAVPAIDARYRTVASPRARAMLGWSLGAASAFGIGWQYPELFGAIGVFSPSFWLARDNGSAEAAQATRIAHALVDAGAKTSHPRVFIAVGDAEETDDRDDDGLIDVVDDAGDLLAGWAAGGRSHRGLRQFGLPVDPDGARSQACGEATLFVLKDGVHRQSSWAQMLPAFLRWAYAADERTTAGC